jgi:hypothetical protein
VTVTDLPPIDVVRRRCQALAVLEAHFGDDEPFYWFDAAWGADEAALMSNGSGDEWAIVFTQAGAFIRVFDHESELSPYANPGRELRPGLLDGMPEVFGPQIAEPAFSDGEGNFLATAVLWRTAGDDRWHAGAESDEDGSDMLDILKDDIVDDYVEFAEDYYEVGVDRAAVEHIVAHRPLTEAVAHALNPDADFAAIRAAAEKIGYPAGRTAR